MSNKTIQDVCIGRDVEAYQYTGDDGYPAGQSFSPVCVQCVDGTEYFLPIAEQRRDEEGFVYYRERYNAERMLVKVQRRRWIETNRWIQIDNRPLQDKFEDYEVEEYYDRMSNGYQGSFL